jgi:diguanylate cyclase (GGDEF)-like protein/PAS domain S-box-containing protein
MRQLPRLRTCGLLLTLALVVGSLGVLVAAQQRASRQGLVERFELRSQLAGRFIDAYLQDLARRQHDIAAARLSSRHTQRRDFQQLVSDGRYAAAVLLDDEGRVLQVAPSAPGLLGIRLTGKYEHLRTALATGRVAVSDVVPSAARGVAISALAVPYSTPYGRRVFSGAYDLTQTPLSVYLANLSPLPTARAAIFDSRGHVVASDRGGPMSTHPRAGQILTKNPIRGTPWTVVASVSKRELLAPVSHARSLIPWLSLAGLALLGVLAITLSSRRRRADRLLYQVRESADGAFEHAAIGIALVSLDGHWLRVNPPLCATLGYSEAQLLATTIQAVTNPDDRERHVSAHQQLLDGTIASHTTETRFLSATGESIWGLLSVSLARDAHGQPSHFVTQIQDVTERRRLQDELAHQATHDSLTGLWNRRRFEEELSRCVARTHRYDERNALLMVDLDRFKIINDTFGHHTGDELIKAVADAMRARVRVTDAVARLGGDEFAVLLLHVTPDDAAAIAESIAAAIGDITLDADGTTLDATASVGVSFIHRDSATEQELLIRADLAMYTAKANGRKCTVIDTPGRTRVYHCDDSASYRRLVKAMLRPHADIELVGSGASYAEALRDAPKLQPDVMLMDLATGDETPHSLTLIRAALPHARVVVLSQADPEQRTDQAHAAHATIGKSETFEALARLLRNVSQAIPETEPSSN